MLITLVFKVTPVSKLALAGAATVTTSVELPFRSSSITEPFLKVTLLLKVAVPMAPARPGLKVPNRLIAEVPAPLTDIVPAENASVEVAPRLVVAKPEVVRLPPELDTEPSKSNVEVPDGPEMKMLPGEVTAPNRVLPVLLAEMLTAPAEAIVINPVEVDVFILIGSDPVPMAPLDEV